VTEYSEAELIIPALQFIRDNLDGVTTTELIEHLANAFNPTGHDMQILQGRQDTYFSQKVRNLKSHNTLTDTGWADYRRILGNGLWTITSRGLQYLRTRGL